jgi:hypothetical protein
VSSGEKFFIGGDFNGHVGTARKRFERVYEGFGYGEQNQKGEKNLNFVVAYDIMTANTFFIKKKNSFNYLLLLLLLFSSLSLLSLIFEISNLILSD